MRGARIMALFGDSITTDHISPAGSIKESSPAGQWLLAHQRAWVQRTLPGATAPLAWLGRWSLTWYMLHQPVLIAALALVRQATAP